MTSMGLNSRVQGEKHGFNLASTSESSVFDSDRINTVIIATQHHLHAPQVMRALEKNKNVFVEKPLAIDLDELEKIKALYDSIEGEKPYVMVGFNRRFSPHIRALKSSQPINGA